MSGPDPEHGAPGREAGNRPSVSITLTHPVCCYHLPGHLLPSGSGSWHPTTHPVPSVPRLRPAPSSPGFSAQHTRPLCPALAPSPAVPLVTKTTRNPLLLPQSATPPSDLQAFALAVPSTGNAVPSFPFLENVLPFLGSARVLSPTPVPLLGETEWHLLWVGPVLITLNDDTALTWAGGPSKAVTRARGSFYSAAPVPST